MHRNKLEIAVMGALKCYGIAFDTNHIVKQKFSNLIHEEDNRPRGWRFLPIGRRLQSLYQKIPFEARLLLRKRL